MPAPRLKTGTHEITLIMLRLGGSTSEYPKIRQEAELSGCSISGPWFPFNTIIILSVVCYGPAAKSTHCGNLPDKKQTALPILFSFSLFPPLLHILTVLPL